MLTIRKESLKDCLPRLHRDESEPSLINHSGHFKQGLVGSIVVNACYRNKKPPLLLLDLPKPRRNKIQQLVRNLIGRRPTKSALAVT
jgi:hypothetical protein